jgi:hypothetical protein
MLKRLSSIAAISPGLKLQFQITFDKMFWLDASVALGRVPNSMRARSFTNSAGRVDAIHFTTSFKK